MRKKTTKRAAAVVADWVLETEARLNAVAKQSLQELVEEVQTPRAKGGNMRIDTGFLRASGQGSIGSMPTGPSRRPDDTEARYDDGSAVPDTTVLTIARLKLGDVFYFGWTANYAKYREAKDAFLRRGVQNWQKIVASVVGRLAARIGKQGLDK